MSEPIKVGDLVVVVRAHCKGSEKYLGEMHRVSGFGDSNGECAFCNASNLHPRVADFEDGRWLPLFMLKRIPPLDDLKGLTTEEGIHQPTKSKEIA